jgi:hypothetical protein
MSLSAITISVWLLASHYLQTISDPYIVIILVMFSKVWCHEILLEGGNESLRM